MTDVRATLTDGSTLTVSVTGTGPTVLLPVRSERRDEASAADLRAWGGDPDVGPDLIAGLADRYRVVAADYEGHRLDRPAPSLSPEVLVADILAIADAAGADRFAWYGYSWLGLTGLQLATRSGRLSALAMGGFPPIDGPYGPMLDVTTAAHRRASEPAAASTGPAEPGDWDTAGLSVGAAVTGQFVALYEALQTFDDTSAAGGLTLPRLTFAGADDVITYAPGWGDTVVDIAGPLVRRRDHLTDLGWEIAVLPGLDHLSALHAAQVLPVLRPWLDRVL